MRLDYALFALIAPLAVIGDLRHSGRRSHHDIAKRADASVQPHKRAFGHARWSFYDVGGAAGACGAFNSPDEHIVALNSAQYGGGYPGPNCGKTIVMTYNGKTTTARITDECPGCPYGGLDLTRGLFQFFDTLDTGIIYGEWHFAGDDDEPPAPKPTPKPSPKPKPTPKTTYKPPPPPPTTHHHTTTSTTHTTHKTTSTHEHSSTHSSTHSTSSSASSPASSSSSASSSKVSSTVSSNAAIPTGVVSAGNAPGQNIAQCNKALLNMGNLIVAGGNA